MFVSSHVNTTNQPRKHENTPVSTSATRLSKYIPEEQFTLNTIQTQLAS